MNVPLDGQPDSKPIPNTPRRKPSATHARALSALQGLAKPQPRATGENPAPEEIGGPGSASGFVGMLAKRQIGEADFHLIEGKTPEEARAVPPAKYSLQMAREVMPEEDPPAVEDSPIAAPRIKGQRGAGATNRNRALVPITFALAGVLLAIGCWAGGAVIYMENVTPMAEEDVHYPLIAWSLNVGEFGGYTQASRMMAWAMLACVPVALGLLVMAEALRRRNARDTRRARA